MVPLVVTAWRVWALRSRQGATAAWRFIRALRILQEAPRGRSRDSVLGCHVLSNMNASRRQGPAGWRTCYSGFRMCGDRRCISGTPKRRNVTGGEVSVIEGVHLRESPSIGMELRGPLIAKSPRDTGQVQRYIAFFGTVMVWMVERLMQFLNSTFKAEFILIVAPKTHSPNR